MSINDLVKKAHENSLTKGWYDDGKGPTFGESIALIHGELSEALEFYREGHKVDELIYTGNGKPDGIPAELADVLIRIFDTCGWHKIDLQRAVDEKMAYNATRPHRHGGKVL